MDMLNLARSYKHVKLQLGLRPCSIRIKLVHVTSGDLVLAGDTLRIPSSIDCRLIDLLSIALVHECDDSAVRPSSSKLMSYYANCFALKK